MRNVGKKSGRSDVMCYGKKLPPGVKSLKQKAINIMDTFIKNNDLYLRLLSWTAPLLNLFSSLIIALYAPSMPAIAEHLGISQELVKNTVTLSMLGFALGSLFFGVLMDFYGRRKILVLALFCFIVISTLAPMIQNIEQLMLIRFFQGFLTASCSIGSRAILVDCFKGQQFNIAILYTTVAYGFGLMVAPFFGGYVQYYFGWQGNFYVYVGIAFFIEIILILFIKESLNIQKSQTLLQTFKQYGKILKHRKLVVGILILGLVQLEQLILPTVGVFLIQDELGFSSVLYGYMALCTGFSYLVGTLLNRFLLNTYSFESLVGKGFSITAFAVIIQILFALSCGLTLWGLVLPIILFNIGLGFIFGNIIAYCLRIFPENAGISLAAQTCYLMLLSGIGVFVISGFKIVNLWPVPAIYAVILSVQLLLFHFVIKEPTKT